MSAEYYAREIVDEVNAILSQSPKAVGPITQWNQALEVLMDAKIAYVVENVPSGLLMVHPDNRSKLGVNAFNVHRVGRYIKRVGADLNELRKATAFELCPIDPKRSVQLDFNQQLVDKSAGMLAPLSGGERYLSVACGHTAQFAKATAASCRTPQTEIADTAGNLNVQHLGKGDARLLTMLTKGWSWTILPWQCEATWPTLPDLAQRALNASNSVASQASELETAASIAEFAQMQSEPVNWDACVDAAAASMPPCKGYIGIIGTYVRLYGGGHGGPMIKYLDEFAKQFGANKVLGEEFLTSVTNVAFSFAKNLYPHIRTGLIATNLVSPKVVDGISRLLVKSGVERLRGRDRAQLIDKAEQIMGSGWDVAMQLLQDGACSTATVYPVIGRLHTRVALHITGKAKLGFERRVFKDMEEIKSLCIAELTNILPDGTTIPSPWANAVASSSAAQEQPEQQSSLQSSSGGDGMVDISKLSNPEWLAKQAGFVVDKPYFEKGLSDKKIYYMKEINESGARLRKHDPMDPEGSKPEEVLVDLDSLLKSWAEHKGELPSMISSTSIESRSVATSKHFEMEGLKAIVFQALQKHEMAYAHMLKCLTFMANPADLRAKAQIPKGKLEMSPATELRCISSRLSSGVPHAQVASNTFCLSEPSRARSLNVEGWKPEAVFVPYWWVGTTHNEVEANIALKKHNDKDFGVSFNVMTNTKVIKANERLLLYKARAIKSSSAKAAPFDEKEGQQATGSAQSKAGKASAESAEPKAKKQRA